MPLWLTWGALLHPSRTMGECVDLVAHHPLIFQDVFSKYKTTLSHNSKMTSNIKK